MPSTTTPSLPRRSPTFGGSGVLKTRRLGYDGKGQRVFRDCRRRRRRRLRGDGRRAADPRSASSPSSARSRSSRRAALDGALAAYDPAENVHRDGILHTSTVPAAISPADRRGGAPQRLRHPRGARLCRRHRRRVLRARRRLAARQRDRAARPQFRPLDRGGLRRLAVRAAYPRHRRPAARRARRGIPTA